MCSKNNYVRRSVSALLAVVFASLVLSVSPAFAQTTVFTYQGRLTDSQATSSTYDLQFTLNNGATLLTCNGAAATNNICEDVPVTNGIFTVQLNFGAAFDSTTRTLGIAVRRGTEMGAFTPLSPNQPITSTPYAIQSLNAMNATQLGGVTAGNYLQTTGSGANLTNLNASNISSGTLNDTNLSSNVALRNTMNTFTGNQFFTGNLSQTGTTADLNLTNGFVARGTLSTGTIPAAGEGVRMMFYPAKAAFRAGRVDSTQWDDANIGLLSTAFGNNTRATNRAAFAAGELTLASGQNSTALGYNTTASGDYSTALGYFTTASGDYSTALGYKTTASGVGSTALGNSTTASGNTSTALGYFTTANGSFSTAMGYSTNATGNYSIALGFRARTGCASGDPNCATPFSRIGSIIFADASGSAYFDSTTDNEFAVRAAGGFRFRTAANLSTGCDLPAGSGVFACTSSREQKNNFLSLSGAGVLAKLRRVPVMEWSYKEERAGVRHIGAFAEDFYREFRLGTDAKSLGLLDIAGVNTAAIMELDSETQDNSAQIKSLQTENNVLKGQLKQQQTTIDALKKLVCASNPTADICK